MFFEPSLLFLTQLARGRDSAKLQKLIMRSHSRPILLLSDPSTVYHNYSATTNIASKHLFTELRQTAVIMVPHISQGLHQLLADLGQRVTFKEVKTESLALNLREGRKDLR